MVAIPEDVRAVIESGALAHLVTLNRDGSPQISCVWVGLDGDELVSAHLSGAQRKLANVRRDPRVSLSLEAKEGDTIGMRHRPARARAVTEGGAPELLQSSHTPTRAGAVTDAGSAPGHVLHRGRVGGTAPGLLDGLYDLVMISARDRGR